MRPVSLLFHTFEAIFLSLEKVAILTFLFSGLDDFFRFQNCNFFATNTISYCSELKLEE